MPSSWLLPSPADAFTIRGRTDLAYIRRVTSDVLMIHTLDGGEISVVNGTVEMADGLFNAFYLSLFGGNEEDSGLEADNARQWWGNFSEPVEARRYRSETQALLRALPAVPSNMRKIEDAVGRDTAWMVDEKIVDAVSAQATMPGRNRLGLLVSAIVSGSKYPFNFDAPWGDSA
jgi:phage gp46-like protein